MTDKPHIDPRGYKLEWIACKFLSVVWVQAQRKLHEGRAQEIAANFDPELLNPVRVTLPNGDGIYHICDGQHGKRAVEILWGPEEKVPCLVAPEGDPVRAAKLFLKMNTGRRPPDSIDKFKVSVTAQEKLQVAINRIVMRNTLKVDHPGAFDTIGAVAALEFVYTNCSAQVLDLTLNTCRLTWAGDRNAFTGPILKGVGVFLNEFASHIDHQRLRETTAKRWSPGSLLRDAKTAKDINGGSVHDAIVELLMSNYNRGLRGESGKVLKHKPAKDKPKDDDA